MIRNCADRAGNATIHFANAIAQRRRGVGHCVNEKCPHIPPGGTGIARPTGSVAASRGLLNTAGVLFARA
eukprot:1574495-Lingulodinium_polyedra.AAC.1